MIWLAVGLGVVFVVVFCIGALCLVAKRADADAERDWQLLMETDRLIREQDARTARRRSGR